MPLWNPSQTSLLIFCQAVASVAMATVIWFVQVVHYPLFDRVGREGFTIYEMAHSQLIEVIKKIGSPNEA